MGELPIDFSVQCMPSTTAGKSRIVIQMPQSQGCWISGGRTPAVVSALNTMMEEYTPEHHSVPVMEIDRAGYTGTMESMQCAPDGTVLFSSRTSCDATVTVVNSAIDDFLNEGPFRNCRHIPVDTSAASVTTDTSATPTASINAVFVAVQSSGQVVKQQGESTVLPIRISYNAGDIGETGVRIIVSVQHPDPSYRNVYTSAVLATSGANLWAQPQAANDVAVNISFGSWTKPSDEYVLRVHLTTAGWRERFASSSPVLLSIVQERVLIEAIAQRIVKARNRSVSFEVGVRYETMRFSSVHVLLVVKDSSGQGGYLTRATLKNSSTTSSLSRLHPSGSIMLVGTLGSWTPTANEYTVTALISEPGLGWRGRFLASQTVSVSIIDEFVYVEGIDVQYTTTVGLHDIPALPIVTKRQGAAVPLPVSFEYAAATLSNISIITAVRRLDHPGKNYVHQALLANMSPSGVVRDITLHVGSWIEPDHPYQVLLYLTSIGEGWQGRFAMSPGFPFYVQSEFVDVVNFTATVAMATPTVLTFTVRYAAEPGTAVTIIPRVMHGATKFIRRSYRVGGGAETSLVNLASSGVVAVAVELGTWATPSTALSPYNLVVQLTRGAWSTRFTSSEPHYFHIVGE